jgi:hypothetical protein
MERKKKKKNQKKKKKKEKKLETERMKETNKEIKSNR